MLSIVHVWFWMMDLHACLFTSTWIFFQIPSLACESLTDALTSIFCCPSLVKITTKGTEREDPGSTLTTCSYFPRPWAKLHTPISSKKCTSTFRQRKSGYGVFFFFTNFVSWYCQAVTDALVSLLVLFSSIVYSCVIPLTCLLIWTSQTYLDKIKFPLSIDHW